MAKKKKVKEYEFCIRCGRRLKSPENRIRGMGDVCWAKYQSEKLMKPLFNPQEISAKK